MTEKRLFIGIPIPHAIKKEIEIWEKKQTFYHNIRWTPLSNLHITILFLGNINENEIDPMASKLKEVAQSIKPFYIKFDKFGYLNTELDAKMIWANFIPCNQLNQLQQNLLSALNTETNIQRLKPHITLARIKSLTYPLIEEGKKIKNMLVENIVLWESILGPKAPVYKTLGIFGLGNPISH